MPNQLLAFDAALRAGVTGLMLDVVAAGPGGADARLCHDSCAFGSVGLVEGLGRIADFLAGRLACTVT
jgi:hypothetical protein